MGTYSCDFETIMSFKMDQVSTLSSLPLARDIVFKKSKFVSCRNPNPALNIAGRTLPLRKEEMDKPQTNLSDFQSCNKKQFLSQSQNCHVMSEGTNPPGDPSKIEKHLRSLMVIVSPYDQYEEVIGHEKAILAIQKSFGVKNSKLRDIVSKITTPEKAAMNGILLVGLPGVGKSTICGAAAAMVARSLRKPIAVFSVSSASLCSKYIGESEKLIECLYKLAEKHGPSLILFDEIDGMMRARNENEDEHSRRFKTQLLLTLQGTKKYGNVVTVGGTNRGWELDAAFLRRFEKVYIVTLPDDSQRLQILKKSFREEMAINYADLQFNDQAVLKLTEGFTGDDIKRCVKDFFMESLRYQLDGSLLTDKEVFDRRMELEDETTDVCLTLLPPTWDNFVEFGIRNKIPSVKPEDLKKILTWQRDFGFENSGFDEPDATWKVKAARSSGCGLGGIFNWCNLC